MTRRIMATVPKIKKNNAWVWIFLALLAISVGVAVFMIRYNLGLQLKREQLVAAREMWQEKGPRDYRMIYTTQRGDDPNKDRFVVDVRAGRVQSVIMNQTIFLEPSSLPYHSMDRLFSDIARFMDEDERAGNKVYLRATFDARTGALKEYVRRIMGGRQRVQIEVLELQPLPAAGS
jgi:hypothetical protein